MVVIELGVEITAKHVQARPDVSFQRSLSENLGNGACRLTAPQFELEQAVFCRGVSLRKKQVGFVLRVDVIDAPAVTNDFDRLRHATDLDRRRGPRLRRDARSRCCNNCDDHDPTAGLHAAPPSAFAHPEYTAIDAFCAGIRQQCSQREL
jgi:hypothetical protein